MSDTILLVMMICATTVYPTTTSEKRNEKESAIAWCGRVIKYITTVSCVDTLLSCFHKNNKIIKIKIDQQENVILDTKF